MAYITYNPPYSIRAYSAGSTVTGGCIFAMVIRRYLSGVGNSDEYCCGAGDYLSIFGVVRRSALRSGGCIAASVDSIPKRHRGKLFGANTSPGLRWTSPPGETVEPP